MPVGDDPKVRNRWAALGWLDDQRPAIGGNRVVTCNRIGLAEGLIVDDGRLTGYCPTRPDTYGYQALRRDEVKGLSIGGPGWARTTVESDLASCLAIRKTHQADFRSS